MDLFFSGGAAWFTVPAVTATAIFLLQLVLILIGADDGGLDLDVDLAVDGHHSTFVFHILSFQTIASFVMGFGWAGFAAYRGMGWDFFTSALVGAAAGAGMVWLLYTLLKTLHGLQTSGNVGIHDAVGREGQVYVSIPSAVAAPGSAPGSATGSAPGVGQVRLVVGNRDRTYTARAAAEFGEAGIERGRRVRVVAVNPDNTVTVAPA